MMKRECDGFPDLNHKSCILDPYETIVADYFESRDFSVERLCAAWLPDRERTPDFRITDAKGWRCLCEVKGLTVSTGALTKADWVRANRMEFERQKAAAEKMGVRLVGSPKQMMLGRGKIPYPGERNTEEKERQYERAIYALLKERLGANRPLRIVIYRNDILVWTDEERKKFVDSVDPKCCRDKTSEVSGEAFSGKLDDKIKRLGCLCHLVRPPRSEIWIY
jgi:hypothetical protein